MLFVDGFVSAVTDLIAGAIEFGNDFPWSCMFDHYLSNSFSLFVRVDSALGEYFVTDLEEKRIWSLDVDVFAMYGSVFMDEDLEDFS